MLSKLVQEYQYFHFTYYNNSLFSFDYQYAASHVIQWDKFQYKTFDLPSPDVRNQSYATRYLNLLSIVPEGN